MTYFKVGDTVKYKGGIGPKMIVVAIDEETHVSKYTIKSIHLKFWDEFLSMYKLEQINSPELIEIATD